jgi:hypothetical protein
MDLKDSALDDPDYAAFAWARYKKLMLWMVLASCAATLLGLGGLYLIIGTIPLHMMIATGLGVFVSVLLAAALMGLVFLSAGSGHDDAIGESADEEV